MNTTTPVISPLRQRMTEDMRMRKLAPKTQIGYIRAVRHFAGFLGRSPDSATASAGRARGTAGSATPMPSWSAPAGCWPAP